MAKKSLHYNDATFEISYEILNPKAQKNFIVLHGWGSNKELMKQTFSSHLQDFRHIYVDLPGFGGSSCEQVLFTQDYANILEIFLQQISAKKDVILGHSFGGKVATLLEPKLLVLVASAGIVVPKPLSVMLKIKLFKMLKPFGIAKLRSLFVAQDAQNLTHEMYSTFKNVVDEDFTQYFKNFNNKALLFWGKDDTATPISTAKEIDTLLAHSELFSYDGDHYFFMQKGEEIAKEITLRS